MGIFMENEIIKRLDSVIELVEDMKDIIVNGDADAPQEFFEAAQDVQDQIGRILHDALLPILKRNRAE
jgi:prephenate dehydrogenase